MPVYDITVPISPDMPVWPGDPRVTLARVSKIEEGANANISQLMMSAHTGTHVDAPYHFLSDGVTLDKVPLDLMVGDVYVVHLPAVKLITADILAKADLPSNMPRLLFKTDNSAYWARGEHEFQTDFVALSPDGAQYLVDRGLKLVGIDYLSIAPYKQSRPTHEILLRAGVLILEGIDLSAVGPGAYTLYCLPLNLQGVDGAPARVVLIGA